MIKLLTAGLLIGAVILIASPDARAALWRRLPAILVYGAAAGAILLMVTGRASWIVAALGALLAVGRRLLPWLAHVPALARLISQWRGRGARGARDGHDRPSGDRAGRMSAARARDTLGVGAGATTAEIIAAHRRLMQRVHPDRGGSATLASQINEARDVLLGRRGENTTAAAS